MTQEFVVHGKLPGANDCLWKHWRTFRQIKIDAQRKIAIGIRAAKIAPMEFVAIYFTWHELDQRRDLDNIIFAQKFVLDALVATGIVPTDGWAHVVELNHRVVLSDASGVRVILHGEEVRSMATKKPVKKTVKKAAVKPKAKKEFKKVAKPSAAGATDVVMDSY